MRFEKALEAMREGKKTKYKDCIYFLDDIGLRKQIVDGDGFVFLGHLHYNDITSEDWEMLDEDEYDEYDDYGDYGEENTEAESYGLRFEDTF